MKTQSEIQDYVKRPGRYSNIDGSGEMTFGAMYLAFALLGYLQSILPKDSTWRHDFSGLLFMYIVLVPAMGLAWWGTKAIKKYITYPRTGYVAYNWAAKRSVVAMIVAGVAGAVVSAAFAFAVFYARRHNAVDFLRMGMLIGYGAPYLGAPFLSKGHSWKWFVALFMAVGLAVVSVTARGDVLELFPPVALFVGLTWLASGGITLYLYIRRTHPPVGMEN
jgi:hypothetical protein